MSASAAAQGIYSGLGPGYPVHNGGPSTINYQGMPATFHSHPYISPYDNAVEKHYNHEGLWYRDAVGHFGRDGRKYTWDVQLEWLRTKVRNFDEQVGDPDAWILPQTDENFLVAEQVLRYRMFFPPMMSQAQSVLNNGMKLTTTAEHREGWRFSGNVFWNPESSGTYSAYLDRERFRRNSFTGVYDDFDAITLGALGGIGNPGIGFTNQQNLSDLGIVLDILSTPGDELLLIAVETDLIEVLNEVDFGARGTFPEILTRTLISQLNLPLQNGGLEPTDAGLLELGNDGIFPWGVYQRFDIDFRITHSVETFGAGAQYESDTLFARSGVKFRGVVGGRYMRIQEGFHFRGIDSGLIYDVTNDPSLVDRVDNDNDFIVDELDEGGAGGEFAPFNPSDELLIRAFVDSVVKTDLGGPEIGLSYEVAESGRWNISGSTKVGALMNREQVTLNGDNIGRFDPLSEATDDGDGGGGFNALGLDVDPVTGELILSDLYDTSTSSGQPTLNAFSDVNGTRHVSPMFEQNLTANIPLFDNVPILRDVPVLQHSTLQLGWTFLWVGEVAAPQKSIIWQSNPRAGLFPHIGIKRYDFYQNSFRLGVNCEY